MSQPMRASAIRRAEPSATRAVNSAGVQQAKGGRLNPWERIISSARPMIEFISERFTRRLPRRLLASGELPSPLPDQAVESVPVGIFTVFMGPHRLVLLPGDPAHCPVGEEPVAGELERAGDLLDPVRRPAGLLGEAIRTGGEFLPFLRVVAGRGERHRE